jgi:hypothetical protein
MENIKLQLLLNCIEMQLEWGPSLNWQGKDFERLNQLILDKTKVSLSSSTLRRLWGKVEYQHQPSTTTLDTLSQFAGFADWRAFTKQHRSSSGASAAISKHHNITAHKHLWVIMFVSLIGVAAAGYSIYKWHNSQEIAKATNNDYLFNSKPVTRDIPNSIVFTYDTHAAPNDSVYIQQSWDNNRRTKVDRALHYHTSIYYRPGFYRAKLIVGKQVVKEHPIIIATHKWLGLIAQGGGVPIYLNKKDFVKKHELNLSLADLTRMHSERLSNTATLEIYNVGNFAPTGLRGFSFRAAIRSNISNLGDRCHYMNIVLISDGVPIVIPLSEPGCVSELNLFNGQAKVSGKLADLSGFAADLNKWTDVTCKEEKNSIMFFINNKLAYQAELPKKALHIIGIGFIMQGGGNARNIVLTSNQHTVFKEF